MVRAIVGMPTDRSRLAAVIGEKSLHVFDRDAAESARNQLSDAFQPRKRIRHADRVVGAAGVSAAEEVVGVRDEAIANIKAQVPHAKVHLLVMDLMNMESVVAAAKEVLSKETKLHGLINSAGIMATPSR